ncbi:protein kinase domain-containing protein [Rhodococcus opacus]|uniref:protein kinase domain-containing protein n=1 Tax=Rhodococcus opacus TaxID=37919 RepID=UPI0024BB0F5D|nr:protein kinase [Rhodococcus opacus]MDJ0414309.1 protein kinase [Rhodococcus opacus]
MIERNHPRATRDDLSGALVAELRAAGFDDPHEIGHGGFGVVFHCRQPSLERTVAVKVLTSSLDPDNVQRFWREQRAMGRLSGHPNIVEILQVGSTGDGSPYIVMPYHRRDSLDAQLRRNGPIAWPDALTLGVKMAGALETAHHLDVLHRDVKPANILFTDYGEPQLTDFGIAHMAGAFETSAGMVTGSPAFTAPEVLVGDSPTSASDVYSLGATLFCAITGHAPFERHEGEQVVAQFLRITTQPVPDLSSSEVPRDISGLIEQAMARTVGARPASAAEFGEQLRAAQRRHQRPVDDMALLTTRTNVDPPSEEHTQTGPAGSEPTELSPATPEPTATTSNLDSRISMPVRVRDKEGNLPVELTSFVGRRHEVAGGKKLLSSSRLVALTGIGGVGKTRLALRIATDSRRAFTDGVWLIELGELTDPELVASAVATALGLRDQSATPPLVLLTNYLVHKQLLLVLDNCEHLIRSVSTLADTVLQTCAEVRILATSREPLAITGETVMRVPPMTVPDPSRGSALRGLPSYESVTLFVDRAAAAVPGFELTEDNQAAVAQICARLDGLPLPIELAASRLRAMSVQQILERLTDRYRILTGGSRAAPTRQQTLRLSIDWSYELCTAAEQQLWARLAVFSRSFELDAAEAICSDADLPEDLLDLVASLVDKSILIREEVGDVVRYRLLDLLHDYAREKLQSTDQYPGLIGRYRNWYEQLVLRAEAHASSPQQLSWLNRLDREQPNLRATLQLCLSDANDFDTGLRIAGGLFPFWLCRGYLHEGRLWLDRVLAAHNGELTPTRAKALYLNSILAGVQGDSSEGSRLLAEADAIFARDPSMSALREFASGCLPLYRAEPAQAVPHLQYASPSAQDDPDRFYHVGSLLGLGLAFMQLGDTTQALACHEEMLALTEKHGEMVFRGRAAMTGGWAWWREGDPTRARSVLEQGIRLSNRTHDPVGIGRNIQTLAWIEAHQNHADRAAVLLGAAAGIWREIGLTNYLDQLIDHQQCEKQTRHALGGRQFEKAFQHGGAMTVNDAVGYALGQHFDTPASHSPETTSLTRRERQVADLVAKGLTNKAIADQLVISRRTAQGHVEHILAKLGFTSRTQIAAWIIETNNQSEDFDNSAPPEGDSPGAV